MRGSVAIYMRLDFLLFEQIGCNELEKFERICSYPVEFGPFYLDQYFVGDEMRTIQSFTKDVSRPIKIKL